MCFQSNDDVRDLYDADLNAYTKTKTGVNEFDSIITNKKTFKENKTTESLFEMLLKLTSSDNAVKILNKTFNILSSGTRGKFSGEKVDKSDGRASGHFSGQSCKKYAEN